MIAIVWYEKNTTQATKTVVGSEQSILGLANIFESNGIKFKVTSVDTRVISQEFLGVGGFKFWLKENDNFELGV